MLQLSVISLLEDWAAGPEEGLCKGGYLETTVRPQGPDFHGWLRCSWQWVSLSCFDDQEESAEPQTAPPQLSSLKTSPHFVDCWVNSLNP